jgi:hypothetical protein
MKYKCGSPPQPRQPSVTEGALCPRLIDKARPMSEPDSNLEKIYFLRVFTNGIERHKTEGLAFLSDEEAWHEASTSAGEIIREMDGKMHPGLDWRMDVTDATGQLIFRFSFKAEEL